MQAAEVFYRDALGLAEVVRYNMVDRTIVQMAPDGVPPGVELWYQVGQRPNPHPTQHLAFAVEDVPSVVSRAAGLGYQVIDAPFKIGDETLAFLSDPDGHIIEVNDFRGRVAARNCAAGFAQSESL